MVIKYRVFQCVGCLEVVEVDGEMKGMKKSETTPRFYEGDWENNSTVNRNKDIRNHPTEQKESRSVVEVRL